MKKSILLLLLMLLPMAANAKVLIDGIYYEIGGDTATVVSSSTKYSGDIIIPDTISYHGSQYLVTAIEGGVYMYGGAFRSCSELTKVILPNTLKTIGGYAFNGCSALTELTIPNTVTYIGDRAFMDCSSLTNMIIPDSVTYLGESSLRACYGLTNVTIGNSLKSISSATFWECTNLQSVTIGSSVTSIGWYAWEYCYNLSEVHITDIGAWCNIQFEEEQYSNPLYHAHHLFLNGEEIENLVIPNNVTHISDCAFFSCQSLTSVSIPNSITTIGDSTFYQCSNLSCVTIDNAVTSIGTAAFTGCNITDVYITDIEAWCKIHFNSQSSNPTLHSEHFFLNDEEIIHLNIPNTITSINNYAFIGCKKITEVSIPNSVTSIGSSAFYGCSGLTSMTIPNSITSIGASAFAGCSGLTSINIPNSVTHINYGTFAGCSGLTSMTIPNSITSIGASAFAGCSGLTSMTIPNSVTTIGGSAFKNCNGLTNVTISNSVTTIDEDTFYGCSNLTSIIIPSSVTTIGDRAFYNCSGLTSVTIPNSVTTIGGSAFYNCSGLTNVTIPNSVTTIGGSTFCGCSNLTNITLSNTLTSIGSYMFYECSRLEKIEIPNSVTSIGYQAFHRCSLNDVIIPNSINSIANNAFSFIFTLTVTGEGEWKGGAINCNIINIYIDSRITSIKGMLVNPRNHVICYAAIPPVCDANSFTNYSGTLHVPATSLAAYFTADYWKNFANIVGDAVEPNITISQDSVELSLGDQISLSATVTPTNATPNNITWESTNSKIATVYNGKITAVGAGECDIIAQCLNKKAICHVVVNDTTVTITLDQQEAMVLPNHIITLTPSASPIIPDLLVTSSDPSVAAARVVNNKVQVVGIKEGTTTITVGSVDGTAIPATCLVTVYTEPGDLNSDGFVSISDVTSLIDYLLGGDETSITTKNADVNGDGNISISDVTSLIDTLLSGN